MPERNRKAGKAIAAAFAVLAALAVTLWVAPLPIAGQNTRSTITVIYGNGKKLLVRDWNFVYQFVESDTPLNELYLATCAMPNDICFPLIKTSKDLLLVGGSPGPNDARREAVIFPEEELLTIRMNVKKYSGFYDSKGRIVRRANPGFDEVEGVTIVPVQGPEWSFAGMLQAPDTFLSDKKYVYLLNLFVTGRVQGKGIPELFGLSLNAKFMPSSPAERVVEVRFR